MNIQNINIRVVCVALFFFFCINSFAEKIETLQELDRRYNPQTVLIDGSNLRTSLIYANLLYKQNTPASNTKADSVLNKVISFQVIDTESEDYGVWPWSQGGIIGDKNVPLFHANPMLVKLWKQQDKMSFYTRSAFNLSCQRLVEAAERRYDEELWAIGRSGEAYSNVFALYIETLTAAADRFSNMRLKRKARTMWARFYNHFLIYGVDEFLSTNYDEVIFDALHSIATFYDGEQESVEIKNMMDFIYTAQSGVTHPMLKLPIVGVSRDYRRMSMKGDSRVQFLQDLPDDYIVPTITKEINANRQYPFEVVGRAGAVPFTYKSYQLPNVAMGSMSGWGNYFWQQIHCMASAGLNENQRATLFVPGSYTPINGFTHQQELSTLCVYNRLPTLWHITQWRQNLDNIKESFGEFGVGLSDQFEEIEHNNEKIVLRAYGYDFHLFPYLLNDNKIESCFLELRKRTETSPRYHRRKMEFKEYVFPEQPKWFGVFIKIVKEGEKVHKPKIQHHISNGTHSFSTSEGHEVKVAATEQGAYVQIYEEDINLMPRFHITNF